MNTCELPSQDATAYRNLTDYEIDLAVGASPGDGNFEGWEVVSAYNAAFAAWDRASDSWSASYNANMTARNAALAANNASLAEQLLIVAMLSSSNAILCYLNGQTMKEKRDRETDDYWNDPDPYG